MRVQKPKLHWMAEDAIACLEKDGIRVKPASVLLLNHLAEKASRPTDGAIDDWFDRPYVCGNITLFAPSCAADWWITENARVWFADNPRYLILALGYALAHGRAVDAFAKLSSKNVARLFLTWWASKISVTIEQLGVAVNSVLGTDESVELNPNPPEQPEAATSNMGYVVGLLMHNYGGTKEDWLYRYSADQVYSLLAELKAITGEGDDSRERFINQATFRQAVEHVRRNNG